MSTECPKCGAPTQTEKQEKCNFCGMEFHSSNSGNGRQKIFYNQDDIFISDTVFVTPKGDQYPIRNISSVSVKDVNYIRVLIAAIYFIFIGIYAYPLNSYYGEMSFFGLIALIVWLFLIKYQLMIGSGGVLQTSIELPKWKLSNKKNLNNITSAINESIRNLQS
jgi:hypothetical protein